MNYRRIEDVFVNGRCLGDILSNRESGINLSGVNLRNVNLFGVNLKCANLSGADLGGSILKCANLSGANLSGANLKEAKLSYSNLSNADLRCANLRCTDLRFANLTDTNLRDANLRFANLAEVILCYADLKGANLGNANLGNANLRDADLSYANLTDANLSGANLSGVDYNCVTSFYNLQCPEKGSFIGYKIAKDRKVVELLITEDAKRSSGTNRKCRCSKAKVLSITNIKGDKNYDEAISEYDKNFIYKVGEIVEVNNFDEDRWKTCASGIHFFITRDEAIRYW